MRVPFADFSRMHDHLRKEIDTAIARVIDNNSYILGEEVEAFEKKFADYCEVQHAVGVSSGTDALELILRGLEIGEGDEVITPPNSFIATASAIEFAGAKPVFVDCGKDYLIDTGKIEDAITSRTKAIMPVHLYGRAADMDLINQIAAENDLKVIEDSCQAHGARYHGKRTGGLGDAAGFSFFPGKNLGAFGDGGAITSDNLDLIERIGMLRNYGQAEKYNHVTRGFNKRLDGLQAAILSVKLDHLDEWNNQRVEVARKYSERLGEIVEAPTKGRVTSQHVYHLYVIKTERRDELQAYLKEKGINTGLHYPVPIHLQKSMEFLEHYAGDFPRSEEDAKKILTLPVFPGMKDEEVDYVCDSISEFFK
jgi:dTDP-4-amino-4,6-dideoxygalactose transaminase